MATRTISTKDTTKICPYCANKINAKAIKCQYCKEFLGSSKEEYWEMYIKPETSGSAWLLINWRSLKDFLLWKWRICRWEYWLYTILWELVFLLACMSLWFLWWIFLPESIVDSEYFSTTIVILLYIPLLYWIVMVWVLRAHDLWHKWYYLFLCLIPLINFFVWIELWFIKWTKWENQFWEEPQTLNRTMTAIAWIISFVLFIILVILEDL